MRLTVAVPSTELLQDDKLGRLLSGSLSQHYDAVIGSLPKALTEDERIRIRQSAPMSPALGSLSKLPQVTTQTGLTLSHSGPLCGTTSWWSSVASVRC